jgi:hypothetical protein
MFLLACLRGWKSILIQGIFVILFFLFFTALSFPLIIVGEIGGWIILFVISVAMFILGSPFAFIVGFVSGILYAMTETFWCRVSLNSRMGSWTGLGCLVPLVVMITLIVISVVLLGIEWEYEGGLQAISASALLFGLFFGGIAAGIDGLRLAGIGANEYMKRYIW